MSEWTTPPYTANPKFRAVAGVQYRCAIVSKYGESVYVAVPTHFRNHRHFICKGGECCERLAEAQVRAAAALLVYDVSLDGKDWRVNPRSMVPWVIGAQAFSSIKEVFDHWHGHDFFIGCKFDEWQNMEARPCRGSMFWGGPEKGEWFSDILNRSTAVRQEAVNWMAMDLSEVQIHDVLTGALRIKDYPYGSQVPERPGLTRYQIALMQRDRIINEVHYGVHN